MTARVVCIGEAIIDLIVRGRVLDVRVGGAPVNLAVGLTRLGVDVRFAGCVGNDWYGRLIESSMRTLGVASFLEKVSGVPTRTAIVSHDARRERRFEFVPPGSAAENAISPTLLRRVFKESPQALAFGTIPFSQGRGIQGFERFLRTAGRRGILRFFDPNVRLSLFDGIVHLRRTFESLVGHADVVRLNADELRLLTRRRTLVSGANSILKRGAILVLVTDGAKGSWAIDRDGVLHCPAFRVHTRDTTGCGDAFSAASLALLAGQSRPDRETLARILREGNAAGALAALKVGGTDSMPSRSTLRRFLNARLRGGGAPSQSIAGA